MCNYGNYPNEKHHRDFSLAAARLGRNDKVKEPFPIRHFERSEKSLRRNWCNSTIVMEISLWISPDSVEGLLR